MKHKDKIFTRIKNFAGTKMIIAGVLLMVTNTAIGAVNKCDLDTHDRINPELALCATHTYNIGGETNPKTAAEKQMMNEVVALKTTIMTQQMKRQYDYLEVTIKRFKTQLEKAILVNKMEIAGGVGSENSSSGNVNNDRTIILAGAENCRLKASTAQAFACLQNNLRITRSAVAAGNTGQAKRQLDEDIKVAVLYGIKDTANKIDVADCASLNANRDSITNCIDGLNVKIIQKIESNNAAAARTNINPYGG